MSSAQQNITRSELVIGLVGATGTDLSVVSGALSEMLYRVGYEPLLIRLSHIFKEIPGLASKIPHRPEDERLQKSMDAGDELREATKLGDAVAILGMSAIRELREQKNGSAKTVVDGRAYILHSLKRPDEIAALRRVYGSRLLVIGAYTARRDRVTNLSVKIAHSKSSSGVDECRSNAEALVQRDLEESGRQFGQQLRETYPLADFFVDASDATRAKAALERFIEGVFGYPFHTPTKDEFGMFHAQAAALRSSALGRQVGAIIATSRGEVVAAGTNEVPRGGGGLYWADDPHDDRDFRRGHDTMDVYKRKMLEDIVGRLADAGVVAPSKRDDPSRLVEEVLDAPGGKMRGAQVLNVLEYGRVVHAEMAAICDAACRGVSVRGCTLYTTTYPCHSCARHIVAAGISRVVYIEPYPKSMTALLHEDAVALEGDPPRDSQVAFDSFVGLAPQRYMEFFQMPTRKEKDGKIVVWNPLRAVPRRASIQTTYLAREAKEVDTLKKSLSATSLISLDEDQHDETGMAGEAVE